METQLPVHANITPNRRGRPPKSPDSKAVRVVVYVPPGAVVALRSYVASLRIDSPNIAARETHASISRAVKIPPAPSATMGALALRRGVAPEPILRPSQKR